MIRTIAIYLLALSSVLLGWTISTFSQDRPSVFQVWNEVQLIVPLVRVEDGGGKTVNKITAVFNGIARIGRDIELTDGRLGAELDYQPNKYLTLLGSVLERRDELVADVRHSETRLDVGATLSVLLKGFSIRDRNMFEHRIRASRSDTNVYRQRFQISHPLTHNGKTLFSPFLSEEPFYDLTVHRVNYNELFLGVTRTLNRRSTLDIAYIRNDTAPVNVNGLSLVLKITLR